MTVVMQYVMEDLSRVPVRCELASEFRYRKPILDPNELIVIISQSGETADSLAALREAKEQGIPAIERSIMLGIVTRRYNRSIAVSGTHGKTTTTSMLTLKILTMTLLVI